MIGPQNEHKIKILPSMFPTSDVGIVVKRGTILTSALIQEKSLPEVVVTVEDADVEVEDVVAVGPDAALKIPQDPMTG